jgi:ribosome maturation factor RimP
MNIVETVTEIALPITDKLGLILWDVEFKKEGAEWFLRIFIDKKENGISIEDCESVSRQVEAVLDEKDPIQQSYCLEVSSAGLTRELKKDSHLESFIGYLITVNTFKSVNGMPKKIEAKLLGFDSEKIILGQKEEQLTINRQDISKIKIDLLNKYNEAMGTGEKKS